MSKTLPHGVSLSLPVESDIYTWEAVITGPESSLYKGILVFSKVRINLS